MGSEPDSVARARRSTAKRAARAAAVCCLCALDSCVSGTLGRVAAPEDHCRWYSFNPSSQSCATASDCRFSPYAAEISFEGLACITACLAFSAAADAAWSAIASSEVSSVATQPFFLDASFFGICAVTGMNSSGEVAFVEVGLPAAVASMWNADRTGAARLTRASHFMSKHAYNYKRQMQAISDPMRTRVGSTHCVFRELPAMMGNVLGKKLPLKRVIYCMCCMYASECVRKTLSTALFEM